MVGQKALIELYSADTVERSWEETQQRIGELLTELDTCVASLPPGLNFALEVTGRQYSKERRILQMSYYNVKMLITRPCLCRLDRRIHNQSRYSSSFNQLTAAECVDAANALALLFPDEPETYPARIYHGPWWA